MIYVHVHTEVRIKDSWHLLSYRAHEAPVVLRAQLMVPNPGRELPTNLSLMTRLNVQLRSLPDRNSSWLHLDEWAQANQQWQNAKGPDLDELFATSCFGFSASQAQLLGIVDDVRFVFFFDS